MVTMAVVLPVVPSYNRPGMGTTVLPQVQICLSASSATQNSAEVLLQISLLI